MFVAGCYAPKYAPGGPCTTTCPGDLVCVQNVCVEPGTTSGDDADVDVDIDGAMVDAAVVAIDAAPPIDAPPPDPTLIAHWKFDDDPADGSVSDSTGNNHNGVCVPPACPSLVTGVKGGGYRYNPDLSQFVVVQNINGFNSPAFTIAGWMYTDNTNMQIAVMSKPFGSGTGNSWQLENMDDDKVSFSGGSVHSLESNNSVPQMTWTHIAGTWDGTTKRLYINGVLARSGTSQIMFDGNPVYLGADENNGNLALPFDGVLDDLRVYNRVLSAQELQTLAQP
jgi:hypothetical protein